MNCFKQATMSAHSPAFHWCPLLYKHVASCVEYKLKLVTKVIYFPALLIWNPWTSMVHESFGLCKVRPLHGKITHKDRNRFTVCLPCVACPIVMSCASLISNITSTFFVSDQHNLPPCISMTNSVPKLENNSLFHPVMLCWFLRELHLW